MLSASPRIQFRSGLTMARYDLIATQMCRRYRRKSLGEFARTTIAKPTCSNRSRPLAERRRAAVASGAIRAAHEAIVERGPARPRRGSHVVRTARGIPIRARGRQRANLSSSGACRRDDFRQAADLMLKAVRQYRTQQASAFDDAPLRDDERLSARSNSVAMKTRRRACRLSGAAPRRDCGSLPVDERVRIAAPTAAQCVATIEVTSDLRFPSSRSRRSPSHSKSLDVKRARLTRRRSTLFGNRNARVRSTARLRATSSAAPRALAASTVSATPFDVWRTPTRCLCWIFPFARLAARHVVARSLGAGSRSRN
jgi:hypothetical protein